MTPAHGSGICRILSGLVEIDASRSRHGVPFWGTTRRELSSTSVVHATPYHRGCFLLLVIRRNPYSRPVTMCSPSCPWDVRQACHDTGCAIILATEFCMAILTPSSGAGSQQTGAYVLEDDLHAVAARCRESRVQYDRTASLSKPVIASSAGLG